MRGPDGDERRERFRALRRTRLSLSLKREIEISLWSAGARAPPRAALVALARHKQTDHKIIVHLYKYTKAGEGCKTSKYTCS